MSEKVTKPDPGPVTKADLEDLRDRANGCQFVRDAGLPYFVARRVQSDGSTRYELDRQVAR